MQTVQVPYASETLLRSAIEHPNWNELLIREVVEEISKHLLDAWKEHSRSKLAAAVKKTGKMLWSTCRTNGPKGVITSFLPAKPDYAEQTLKGFLRTITFTPPGPIVIDGKKEEEVEPEPSPAPIEEEQKEEVVEVVSSDITDLITVPGKHFLTRRMKRYLKRRKYILAYGCPGGGKSYWWGSIAKDMGLDYLCLTLNPDSTKSELLGNKSPLNGETFYSKFGKFWEFGGVVNIDEVGLGSGGILNLLNGCLESKFIEFPDGRRVPMHPNFFLGFCDNSNLWGADPLFSERQDLGSAFRDRLSYIEFKYDNELELSILSKIWRTPAEAKAWQDVVDRMRVILKEAGVPLFASPRFSFAASAAIMDGDTFEEALESSLWQGLPEDSISSVKNKILDLALVKRRR